MIMVGTKSNMQRLFASSHAVHNTNPSKPSKDPKTPQALMLRQILMVMSPKHSPVHYHIVRTRNTKLIDMRGSASL